MIEMVGIKACLVICVALFLDVFVICTEQDTYRIPAECISRSKENQQCLNPFWFAGLVKKYTNESSCCKRLDLEIQCLSNIVVESLNSCLLLSEAHVSDVSKELSRLNESVKELQQGYILDDLRNKIKRNSDKIEILQVDKDNEAAKREKDLSNITQRFEQNISNIQHTIQQSYKSISDDMTKRIQAFENKFEVSISKAETEDNELKNKLEELKDKTERDQGILSTSFANSMKETNARIGTLNVSMTRFQENVQTEIKIKANDVLDKSLQKIEEESSTIDEKIGNLSTNFNEHLERFDAEVEKVTNKIKDTGKNLRDHYQKEISELNNDIEEKTKGLENKIDTFASKSDADIKMTDKRISELKKEIEDNKKANEKSFSDTKTYIEELVNKATQQFKTELADSTTNLHLIIESLKNDIEGMIESRAERLSSQTKDVREKVSEQKKRVDIIYPNTFNKEMLTMAFLVIVVLVVGNYVTVYILFKWKFQSSHDVSESFKDEDISEEPHSPVEIYNRLNFKWTLKNSVGVISFYEDAQQQHKRLMEVIKDSITEDLLPDVDVEYHVVRHYKDIPGIPRTKICIMFVEFSERHVIIEQPGLGLGDLKRKTADHIVKQGAILMIIYTKDPGSKRLVQSTDLFNKSIHCVTSQPELKPLAKNRRFFSIYDKLSDSQIERIVDIVTRTLRDTGSGSRSYLEM